MRSDSMDDDVAPPVVLLPTAAPPVAPDPVALPLCRGTISIEVTTALLAPLGVALALGLP